MEIIRHADGSLTVPVVPDRHADDDAADGASAEATAAATATMTLRPGEGGYTEALAQWDAQQGHAPEDVVSTASGRKEAMAVVHAVADDRDHVAEAVEALDDPDASADALRHVLVGGTPSVKAFAEEVAEAEGGDPLAPHTTTKIIGEVLAVIDASS